MQGPTGQPMTFEDAVRQLAADISQMTGRPLRGSDFGAPTAPTPQTMPGPAGGPEMRSYQPTPAESISSLVRRYIGGTTGERVAPIAGAIMDYGPVPAQIATDIAQQPVRAGTAVAEAVEDPSLANVTNAGVQTAMAVAQPAKAVGIAAGGLGTAALNQMGVGFSNGAVASDEQRSDGLTPDQAEEYRKSQDIIARFRFKSGAERRYHEGVLARYNKILEDFATSNNQTRAAAQTAQQASEQAEYDRAVAKAESVRAQAEARDVRFGDTEVGKVYNEIGGVLPFLAAYGGGALSRLGTGGGGTMKDYVLPGVMGTGASFSAMNAPLFADMTAPSFNPQKEAIQGYARELPPTHPRKQEFAEHGASLPDRNPVQEQAYEQFYDGLGKRLGVAGIEGLTFGKAGAATVNALPRMIRDVRARKDARGQTGEAETGPTPSTGLVPQGSATGTGTQSGGPPMPSPPPSQTGQSGQQAQSQGSSSQSPWTYQKRGKDGRFKAGYTFKQRTQAPPKKSASSISDVVSNANKKP
jgi:hypothetical protein